MENKGKVYLTEEKETLLLTLYAKALDYRAKRSVLHDKTANDILKKIDYDFEKFEGRGNNLIVIRARQYDEWLREFMAANANAVVLNIGCGLDTRITRINPSTSVSWFDVDYPEVINLRKTFFDDRAGYQMIGSSVIDPTWIKKTPCDRPAIVIAEGLLEYLVVEDVKTLLNRITDHFPQGELIFDVMSPFAIGAGQEKLKETTGAVHKWAVDDPREVDILNPKLIRIKDLSPFKSRFVRQLSPGYRLFYGWVALMPKYKNMLRMLRYRF